ncbi:hypothetical protein BKA62DRAFT_695217 [Auriculariales sp. MPI-PUGE-AT-0066]|nr:hypothetical protein BKA62DRAFT_695217 [Auriculariales sp. MPI-PUGE-AT-0066]
MPCLPAASAGFQSILQSLNIPDPSQGSNTQVTPEMMQKLSSRIMEVLGAPGAAVSAPQPAITADGLPVVEITEPVEEAQDDLPLINAHGDLLPDNFVRHNALSAEERAKRQAATLAFLDELEDEERTAREKEREEAREWAERKKAESAQRASYGAAPPPKASRSSTSAKVSGDTFKGSPAKARPPPSESSAGGKKTVRFVGGDDSTDDGFEDEDLAAPPKVISSSKVAPSSNAALEQLAASTPMKLNVVERRPGKSDAAAPPPSKALQPTSEAMAASSARQTREADSDDETPPSSPSASHSQLTVPLRDDDTLRAEELEELRDNHAKLRSRVELDKDEVLATSRGGVGSGTWDEENVPLDATLATNAPANKSSVSRFKAERIAAAGHLRGDELEGNGESDSDEDLHVRHRDTFEALKNFGMQSVPSTSRDSTAATAPALAGSAPAEAEKRVVASVVRERPAVRSIVAQTIVERPPRRMEQSSSTPAASQDTSSMLSSAPAKKISRFRAEKLAKPE